jgi:hypothetical protein
MSHFAFVNPGGPKVPDIAKAKRYGITRLYWQANDPQISAGLFLAIRERGMEVGIMRDPTWDNSSALSTWRASWTPTSAAWDRATANARCWPISSTTTRPTSQRSWASGERCDLTA